MKSSPETKELMDSFFVENVNIPRKTLYRASRNVVRRYEAYELGVMSSRP
jgi:hypothetical protein